MFTKKKLSDWFVEFSFGKVFFKEITHKLRGDIEIISKGNVGVMYHLYEYELLDLPSKKIDNLKIEDSDLLRNKIKEILLHYKIINFEKPKLKTNDVADIFSKKDIEWFNKQKGVNNGK